MDSGKCHILITVNDKPNFQRVVIPQAWWS